MSAVDPQVSDRHRCDLLSLTTLARESQSGSDLSYCPLHWDVSILSFRAKSPAKPYLYAKAGGISEENDEAGSAGAPPAVSRASRDTIGGFSAGRRKERARRPRSPISLFVIDSSLVIRHSSFRGHDTSTSSVSRNRTDCVSLFVGGPRRCVGLHRN